MAQLGDTVVTGSLAVSNCIYGSATCATTANTASSATKLTTARKTYVTLGTASTTTTRDWSGDTTIPVSGTLNIANGGTGATTALGAEYNLIGSVNSAETDLTDSRYFALKNETVSASNGTFRWNKVSKIKKYTESNYWYGTCSTASATVAKTVTLSGFELVTNVRVTIKFTNANTATNATLNINSTGAKAIYYHGTNVPNNLILANTTLNLVYNGTQYEIVGDLDSTGGGSNVVTGVKGGAESTYRTGNVNITKANIGLGNVDNTSDEDKPVSTAQATAISTAETNAKNLADATGTLAVSHGGTGQTSLDNVTVGSATNSGQLESKTWRQTALQGIWITDNTSSLTASTYIFIPTEAPGSTVIEAGSVVRVGFKYPLQSSSAITEVRLAYGGQSGVIIAAKNDSTLSLKSHVFTGGNYSSTYKNRVWDAYTTLELMWTGSSWLVMGNPDVCKYFSASRSYTVKANGYIEQAGLSSTIASGATETISLYVSIASVLTANCTVFGTRENTGSIATYSTGDDSRVSVRNTYSGDNRSSGRLWWELKGY